MVDRGIYRFGTRNNVTGETVPGTWEHDAGGGCICIADINDDDIESADNGTLMHITQRRTLADIIAERLNLPPAEDLPDVIEIAKAMRKDGFDICEYCPSIGACKECMLNGMFDDEEPEEEHK